MGRKNKKVAIKIILIFMIIFALFLWFLLAGSRPTHLTINEVSFTSNEGNDWIEIYNPSLNSVSLKDYYISDNERNLSKYKISDDVLVPRHGYLLFYGEKHDSVPSGAIQLSFNIANGETVYLVAQDGVTIVDRLTVVGEEDKSVGRFPDGASETFAFSLLTPGERNEKDKFDKLMKLNND